MRKYFLFVYIALALSLHSKAQVSVVSPQKPNTKDSISLTYNPKEVNAKLNGNEPIYARIITYCQDGSIEKFHVVLSAKNGKFEQDFNLPLTAASFKVEFYTLNKDDEDATQNLKVYDNKHQLPIKGAYLEAFMSEKVDSIFQLEITNYPTHYLAYAKYINVISMIKEPAKAKQLIMTIQNKLLQLHIVKNKVQPAGLLAALCLSYAKTGDLATGKTYLFQLFDHYPQAAETAFAFSNYNYEYYKSSSQQIEDDVKARLKAIFINMPKAAVSKDINMYNYLKDDLNIPVEAFENVIKPLYAQDQVSYYALTNLPELYLERKVHLDTAKKLLLNAIARFQDGTIQHQYRLNYSHFQMYVPYLLLNLAKVNLLKNELQEALFNSSAAMQLLSGSNTEGNFLPLILEVRAQAYEKIGNASLAFDDYKKLYTIGQATALDSLQRLFPMVNVKQKDFTSFIAALKPNQGKNVANKDLAPNFSGTDLKGNKVSLADLKGKIVVVNIWGIGCGPCIAEMPMLNELVKAYQNQPDVVFIAITADQKDALTNFFKNRSFAYQVINNVGSISAQFNTNALPVHMVIGKNGEVINRSIGARADIKQFLKQLIDLNL
jgi:thiol-disulfide isomerase/thioredoxin